MQQAAGITSFVSFAVRGADGVPEGGAVDTLMDVGHARGHLGLSAHVVRLHTPLQVSPICRCYLLKVYLSAAEVSATRQIVIYAIVKR